MDFAGRRKVAAAADVVIAIFREPGSCEDEVVIVKGRHLVEDVVKSGVSKQIQQCLIRCVSREEAMQLARAVGG